MTVSNMKLCESVFAKYMLDKHGVDVSDDVDKLRQVLYATMHHTHARFGNDPSKTAREMNDVALSAARNVYIRDRQMQQAEATKNAAAKKASANPNDVISRDRAVYGNRPVPLPPLSDRPVASKAEDDSPERLDYSVKRLLAERDEDEDQDHPIRRKNRTVGSRQRTRDDVNGGRSAPPPARHPAANDSEEDVVGEEEYEGGYDARAAKGNNDNDLLLRSDENDPDVDAVMKLPSESVDPRMTDEECLQQMNDMMRFRDGDLNDGSGYLPSQPRMDNACIDPASVPDDAIQSTDYLVDDGQLQTDSVIKYLSINGFDRDWAMQPSRYSYTIKTAGEMHTNFRNVSALQATCVILPNDIPQGALDPSGAVVGDRVTFQHDFNFSYPYVILTVDGFEDVYDGTNDAVRRAFCKFVYNRNYRSSNGRGYIVLEPMQDEIKRFTPTPLSSLRNLSISIQKPNGTLLNSSRDDYRLVKVEYDDLNEIYLRIVLDKHFDRNEFFVNDVVAFRNVRFYPPRDSQMSHRDALRKLEEFINRHEGHEIIQLGSANDKGFYQTFHVYAPGDFDRFAGQIVLHSNLIEALETHNQRSPDEYAEEQEEEGGALPGGEWRTAGNVMNTSLQNVVAFRVWQSLPDIAPQISHLNKISSHLRTEREEKQRRQDHQRQENQKQEQDAAATASSTRKKKKQGSSSTAFSMRSTPIADL